MTCILAIGEYIHIWSIGAWSEVRAAGSDAGEMWLLVYSTEATARSAANSVIVTAWNNPFSIWLAR